MAERKIGLIPSAVSPGGEQCCVLVTDRRTILVFEEAPKSLRALLRDSMRETRPEEKEGRRRIDFRNVDIDLLARMEGNKSIPHSSIDELKVRWQPGGYVMWMKHRTESGKLDYLILELVPPDELIRKRKAEGVRPKETGKLYAMRCLEAYRMALTPIIAEKVRWTL